MTLNDLTAALASANVQAFLRVIRAGESSQDDTAYRMCFGGTLVDGLTDHPRRAITSGRYTSTAAGAYQFLSRTWDGLVKLYGFTDFGPTSQDLGAVALIYGRGALADVIAGRIPAAISRCGREWASLPGSPYGQPVRTLSQALATYAEYHGTLNAVAVADAAPSTAPTPEPSPPKDTTMPLPLIIGALLPSLIEAIPKLGALFGSGSAVAERNVKAAGVAMQIVQDATGARNAQEAVEMVKADPAVAQAAAKAVEDNWFQLSEVGGGVEAARGADMAFVKSGEPPWKSPSLIVAVLLLPLVYMIVGNVTGLYGAEWSPDARAGIAGSLAGGIVMGLIGYYYGQTTSRNRTPATPAE